MEEQKDLEPRSESQIAPASEINIFDRSHKSSTVNLLPTKIADLVEMAAKAMPEHFGLDEQDLYKRLRMEERTPTPTDNRLRLLFWLEYERAVSSGKKMIAGNLTAGVCSTDYFYTRYLTNPYKVCWLMTPPTVYMVKAVEARDFGIEQMRDILSMPHENGGRPDYKLMEIKKKITEMLDNRVEGGVVQKLQVSSKSTHVGITGTPAEVQRLAMENTEAELEAKFKRLSEKLAIPVSSKKVDDGK